MTSRSIRKGASALLLLLSAGQALAQSASVAPQDEYRARLRVAERVQPEGDTPFGEVVGLYDGSISWSQLDVSLTGAGPAIEVRRRFQVPDLPAGPIPRAALNNSVLGDWTLELPRLDTVVASLSSPDNPNGPLFFVDDPQRCTHLAAAPDLLRPTVGGSSTFSGSDWWHGYQLVVGGNAQDVLARVDGSPVAPQMTIPGLLGFRAVTTKNWAIGCTGVTANGVPGEGFLAVAPDGTKYWLDWLSNRPGDTMAKTDGSTLARRNVSMLVSRVEDRFGNGLTYHYDVNGNPLSIDASDGRRVSFSYDTSTPSTLSDARAPQLRTVTAMANNATPRSWNYNYDSFNGANRLTGILVPGGGSWTFDLRQLVAPTISGQTPYQGCNYTSPSVSSTVGTATMTNPSGLTGVFHVRAIPRGFSNTPKTCVTNADGSEAIKRPHVYVQAALADKTYSGAGIDPLRWSFMYSTPNESWDTDCAGTCQGTVWTDVIDPAGRLTRYTFSNRYDVTNGQWLRSDTYEQSGGGGTPARSQVMTYAAPTTGPWPVRYGASQQAYVNDAQFEQVAPLNSRTITLDGDNYAWRATAFDTFANVVHTTGASPNLSPLVRDRVTEKRNDTTYWVIGLDVRVSNGTTGEEIERNVYGAPLLTLSERWRFGRRVAVFTYDAQGRVVSSADGNGHATTFGDYEGPLPQSIGYPDGTSVTRKVDGFGEILSETNQASATMSYEYDPAGRQVAVRYPGDDTVAWAPTTARFDFATFAEQGIAANHWRRSELKGTRMATTYYDALMRPVLVVVGGDHAVGSSTRTSYDWQGHPTFQSWPVASGVALTSITQGAYSDYDVAGRVIRVRTSADNGQYLTTTTRWPGHASKVVTDPKGYTTQTAYQVFDEPVFDRPVLVSSPEGIVRMIERDIYGYPVSIRQQGQNGTIASTLWYDAAHRPCRTFTPGRGSEILAYDGADNVVWSVAGASYTGNDCGATQVSDSAKTARSYDAMNRLTAVAYPVGTASTSFNYDAVGRVATATSGSTVWTYAHNRRGLLTAEVLAVDGRQWSLGYGYATNGALSTVLYPDGAILALNPNGLGQPTTVGAYASAVDWFPDGTLRTFRLGNGTTYLAQKNSRNTLGNFAYGLNGGGVALSQDIRYDDNGNVSQIADLAGTTGQRTMTYDTRNRLTGISAPGLWGNETYTYDALDNLRSVTGNGPQTIYDIDGGNLLTGSRANGTITHAYRYDERGNVSARDNVPYTVDQADRLLAIGTTAQYGYDAGGWRVRAQTPSTTAYFAYNSVGRLMWEFDKVSALGTSYIYVGNQLIALRKAVSGGAETVAYLYNDAQGSVLATADAQGSILSRSAYKPFGARAAGQPANGPGFLGQREDADTGAVYLKARYFDPAIARYLAPRPPTSTPGTGVCCNDYVQGEGNPYGYVPSDSRIVPEVR